MFKRIKDVSNYFYGKYYEIYYYVFVKRYRLPSSTTLKRKYDNSSDDENKNKCLRISRETTCETKNTITLTEPILKDTESVDANESDTESETDTDTENCTVINTFVSTTLKNKERTKLKIALENLKTKIDTIYETTETTE